MQLPPPTPNDFIPLMGMFTGLVTVLMIGFTIIRVAQSQIGQAIARRIHGKGAADPELRDELEALREQVSTLEHRLSDSEERLDFTERLLAQHREPLPLPDAARLDRH